MEPAAHDPSPASPDLAPPAGDDERLRQLASELSRVRSRLDDLEGSTLGRVAMALRRHKQRVIPLGSRRELVWARATQAAARAVRRVVPPPLPADVAALATTPLRPRVLVVSGPGRASRRYRGHHLVEAVEALGGAGTLLPWDAAALEAHADAAAAACDLLVLHRAPSHPPVQRLIDAARRAGRPVVYDADDLVFDPAEPVAAIPGVADMLSPRWVAAQARTLAQIDAGWFATVPLAEQASALTAAPVRVLRNGFSEAMRTAAADQRRRPADGQVRLVYASGSPTHEADFAQALPGLRAVLAAHPEVSLHVVGPVSTGDLARVVRHPFRPWQELPALLATCDVNLAPLALDTAFARAKSEIKWLEAALVGLPTVASPSPAFVHAIGPDRRGLVAADPAGWERAVARLCRDRDLRRTLGERARGAALADWGPERRAEQVASLLAALGVAVSPGRAPAPRASGS